MGTNRVSVSVSSPSTQFNTQADVVSQNQAGNYSTVYAYLQAINQGGTTSFEGNSGTQSATVGGVAAGSHTSTLPSGVGAGGQRWLDGPFGVNLGHDSAGNRGADTVSQGLSWSGWLSQTNNGSIGPYTRIPKPASKPGTPVASNIMPTSVTLTWTASTDNGGSAIIGYLVRRWTGSTMTGTYVDVSTTNTLTRTDTGLVPGTTYTYGIYAKNGSSGGYSVVSTGVTVKTIAPAHVKVAGVWKYGVPYVKVAGVWKMSTPYVKVSGLWKQTG